MRRLATACVAAAWLATAAAAAAEPIELAARPLPLSEETPELARAGALRFEGALALTSPDARFGGLSALALSPDGRRLIFVSDQGDWIAATPRHDRAGRLVGLDGAEIGALIGPDGRRPRGKRNSDAESLARFEGGLAVSFEHRHRIWRYRATASPFAARPVEMKLPAELAKAPPNGGIEALAALADGRLVALAEKYPRKGPTLAGWVRTQGVWRRFRWRREALFHPSGAARLPDGDLLVLERRFTFIGGFAVRLVRVAADAIRPGALVAGRELARLEPPLIEENFEGIAAQPVPGGVRLYLVSDDNFQFLQRTILAEFALPSPR